MGKVRINIYDQGENIYDLKQYDIVKVDNVLVLVLELSCHTIIYKFFTDSVAKNYDIIEATIKAELSKNEAYFDEYHFRDYITVGTNRFTGQKINTIEKFLTN